MQLQINNKKQYTDDFFRWLLQRIFIVGCIYLNENKNRLIKIDSYLENVISGKRKYKAADIILSGLRNLQVFHNKQKIIISINKRVKLPRNDAFLLSTVCQLINYGNLELKQFPIFTYIFNYIKDNIDDLYGDYSMGVLI